MSVPTADQWTRAFARQARADLDAYDSCLLTPAIAACHALHMLQMACEKAAKAHLCDTGSDPLQVQASHAYTAKVLPLVIREQVERLGPADAKRLRWLSHAIRPLAREIELLSPSVDDGGRRPANCEYPWVDAAGELRVPAESAFPNLAALDSHLGTVFFKLLRAAIDRMAHCRGVSSSSPAPSNSATAASSSASSAKH